MELFVYNWIYTGYTLYGHSLDDDGKYMLLKVTDFFPSCFVEGETVKKSTVVPVKTEYKIMSSSRDISSRRPFHRMYFRNKKDMDIFARENRNSTHMDGIPQVTVFLSQIGADHVGWVRVAKRQPFKHVCAVMSDIVGVPDRLQPSEVKVMSFDIEVRSMEGMPQPHRMRDTVEMISVVTNDSTFLFHTTPGLNLTCHTVMCDDEIDMITRFFTLIESEDPTILTGYNIHGFDLHYLVSRLKLRLVEIPSISRGTYNCVDVIRVDWSSDAYGNNSYDRLVIGGRVILDMYLYFKRMKLDKYSLEFVSNKFLGEGKDDMTHETMMKAFQSGDLAALADVARYCIKDSAQIGRAHV